MSNKVYIATSLDGFIADKNGGIDWLNMIPFNNELLLKFNNFVDSVDALVMGKNTFDIVKNFEGDWPYSKKVFVLSNSMSSIPIGYEDKAELIYGLIPVIVNKLNEQGYKNLYIDGGITIQNFLKEDLIDEMIISTIPIILGGGKSLFGELSNSKEFKLIGSKIISNLMVQSHYKKF